LHWQSRSADVEWGLLWFSLNKLRASLNKTWRKGLLRALVLQRRKLMQGCLA
jgi:hypothetical protein